MNMMGQQSYQIVGEPQERGLDDGEETSSIPDEDIDLVASQAGVSKEKAKDALEECGGEPAEAIIKLMGD
jgi:nascent polypeptide-associated complex subunit alpha